MSQSKSLKIHRMTFFALQKRWSTDFRALNCKWFGREKPVGYCQQKRKRDVWTYDGQITLLRWLACGCIAFKSGTLPDIAQFQSLKIRRLSFLNNLITADWWILGLWNWAKFGRNYDSNNIDGYVISFVVWYSPETQLYLGGFSWTISEWYPGLHQHLRSPLWILKQ